jgi:hypothetical protein
VDERKEERRMKDDKKEKEKETERISGLRYFRIS